jgi:hypothetical protein
MSTRRTLVGSIAATGASVAVLAAVRDGTVDAADGVVLVAALAVLARTAIRLASDPERGHGDDERGP